MMDKTDKKYTAVKPKGFGYYIWFETEKTTPNLGMFIGTQGWGKRGALTDIKCRASEIDSFIYSDELQYDKD